MELPQRMQNPYSDFLEEDVFKNICKLYGYDTPEMISIPITGGEKNYLNWLSKSVA
tara:strand:+ start:570 stop:737 length:168 start_codon:yes stop_codon:yes gene_type:complete